MEAATPLRLVSDQPSGFPWPETGELLSTEEAHRRVRDLTDERDGLLTLTAKQAKENARLARRIVEDEDPNSHPRGAEIVALGERWKRGTGKAKAKLGAPRVKLIKARLKDGFPISAEDWLPQEPTLELAIDGLCANPYRVYNHRHPDGRPSDLDNDLSAALKDEKHVEDLSRLGYEARRSGLVTWSEA